MPEWKDIPVSYLRYLEDMRQHLFRATILFAVVFFIGFLSAGTILKSIFSLIKLEGVTIATSSPFQLADVAMDIGFFLAIMCSIPYVIYGFYAFIAPALTTKEKWGLFKSVPISIGLFLIGFLYGLGVLYYALDLLASINVSLGVQNIWNIGQFLSQMFLTAALLGFLFEFPLLITLLTKMGIVNTEMLRNKRRVAYFAVVCLVALLPPTDGISLLAMSLPLVVLYEGTILVNNNRQKYVWTRN